MSSVDSNGSSNSSSDPTKQNGQQQRQRRNPIRATRRFIIQTKTRMDIFLLRCWTIFKKLSRPMKAFVMLQIVAYSLFLGMFAKAAFDPRGSYAARRAAAPIEVPYSTFLHTVRESSTASSSSYPVKRDLDKPQIINLQIGDDGRMVFRVARAQTKEDKKLLQDFFAGKISRTSLLQKEAKRLASSSSSKSKSTSLTPMTFYTRKVDASPQLIDYLQQHDVPFSAAAKPKQNFSQVIAWIVRFMFLYFYAGFLYRSYGAMSSGGLGGAGSADEKNGVAKLATSQTLPSATFDDIQGMDEAKFEVMELVDTLRNPDKYAILGARAPKGLLLEGPPGTGKTLLVRATAASAGVPLLYCSGSDFIELYVGRGAARVRNTFERASKLAPCILFIDELDALGKDREDMGPFGGRGGGSGGGGFEADQTLNQLLSCMDGLDSSKSQIVVLAATNRRQVLDPALIRPGRFDRIVAVPLPNAAGREAILRVHASKLPGFTEGKGIDPRRSGALGVGKAVDLSAVAAVTQGLSGAELESIVNEAAIRAVRRVSSWIRDQQQVPGELGGEANSSVDVTKLSAAAADASRGVGNSNEVAAHVTAEDFEASVASFNASRKKQRNSIFG